MNFNNKISWAL